ncbi:MAG: hypothetical protein K9M45_02475 [Kiritimatiellales bacterium]|nr:hypothetical protein [Kiritimatiellales bacterium]
MTDNWLNLNGLDAWCAKLKELVDAAIAARNDGDDAKITEVAGRLRNFSLYCIIPESDKLTQIADKALDGLIDSVITNSLKTLGEVAAEMASLTSELNVITDASNRKADWLSLKTPKEIVDRLDETADAITALYETTEDLPNTDAVKSCIDDVVQSISALRDTVQQAV